MELDIIHDLIQKRPSWLKPFPITYAVEYYIDPNPCKGKGDLIVCNEKYDKFLVVEVKRTKRKNKKLLRQMIFYHSQFKAKMPNVSVDCAAVAKGDLLIYMKDGVSDFIIPELYDRCINMESLKDWSLDTENKLKLLPKPKRYIIQGRAHNTLKSSRRFHRKKKMHFFYPTIFPHHKSFFVF